ncbi:MAG TPA: menaquinol oxidoreductase [Nitrospiraceae bacterium]|nr:menaquinol oxidoreductase [Nitrospiraceae bacterium]
MYNGGKILIGLIVFAALFASPFYLNRGKATAKPELKIDTPEIQKLEDKKCVEPKEFMRAEHMQILNNWRDAVVRNGDRNQIIISGQKYDKSLQNGCMKCHSNKKDFCDKCHNYVAVKPYCWDCHIAPKEKKS